VVEELNSGLLRTNPDSGREDLYITASILFSISFQPIATDSAHIVGYGEHINPPTGTTKC